MKNEAVGAASWRRKVARFGISKKSFTFIEMIIVTAMLSVISLAIYKNIDSGAKIWHSVNKQIPTVDLNIFFDKFSTDLKNSFKFKGIDFLGTDDSFEFATLTDSEKLGRRTVGKVAYSFSQGSGILKREVKDFSDIYNGSAGRINESLENLRSAVFSYYYYDKEKKRYLWLDEWAKGELPLAVRVELEIDENVGNSKFKKTVSIPVSG
ncbi:MAG: type II secretion system protein GspJ [Candidatus Omnitrophota bacterium]